MSKVAKVGVVWTVICGAWVAYALVAVSNTTTLPGDFGQAVGGIRTNNQTNVLHTAIGFYIAGIVVLAIVKWVSRSGNKQPLKAASVNGDADTTLRNRLASGEIGEEEYQRLRAALRH